MEGYSGPQWYMYNMVIMESVSCVSLTQTSYCMYSEIQNIKHKHTGYMYIIGGHNINTVEWYQCTYKCVVHTPQLCSGLSKLATYITKIITTNLAQLLIAVYL